MIYNLAPPSENKIKFTKKDFSSYLQHTAHFHSKELFKDEFFSNSPPSIFIGSKLAYPNVNVGILAPPERVENASFYDAENVWPTIPLTINDIIKLRTSLINSRFKTTTASARSQGKFLQIAQEIGMASQAVDVEIQLKKKVRIHQEFDQVHKPMGPAAPLLKAQITENTKIETKVDKVVSDTDLKAGEALTYLYQSNFPHQALSQLLSIGVMGLKHNRKLVPTRWSITSTDDTLGKHIINEIKDYNSIDTCQLYVGNYFGNYYYILLFPDVWSYELFETYLPGSAWNSTQTLTAATDYESYDGRKDYAEHCAGGYYAARLPILEKLKTLRRQASILTIRFETPEYHTGLGVWVVRSASQKTMTTNPLEFSSKEELLSALQKKVKERFNLDVTQIIGKSKLLSQMKEQRKLTSFFN
jgi:hypothetical protein